MTDNYQEDVDTMEFPIVCETCLGPNPYVRMQKFPLGGTCHISGRPYTVFRWKAGSHARYKKTVISQNIAKNKNVCQVCMLDLEYNLPVQVRDKALNLQEESLPYSDVCREYALNRMDDESNSHNHPQKFNSIVGNEILTKLARSIPHFERNQARVCSFFIKGNCNRGVQCPYRHEIPNDNGLSKQNYHDRYYGTEDPVAIKMLASVAKVPTLSNVPSFDPAASTLFVGNITTAITEQDLHDTFYPFGKLESINLFHSRNYAIVVYATHQSAKNAAVSLGRLFVIKSNVLTLRWGKTHMNQQTEKQKTCEKPYRAMDGRQLG